jgi:hypothetical protein
MKKKETMSKSVFIEDYTQKSFVVRGDTKEYKESLKTMGGKWNSGLSDKHTGDKFGAWLFWSDKRKEIESWIEKGCKITDSTPVNFTGANNSRDGSENIKRLEAKVDDLTKMLKSICRHHQIDLGERRGTTQALDSDVESDDDIKHVRPKRLLSK